LAVCLPLLLDAVTAYIAANVSNPLTAPFLIAAEIELGSLLLQGRFVELDLEQIEKTGLGGFALQLAVGSPLVGLVLAALGGLVTWALAGKRPPESAGARLAAIRRTLARYARTRRADRYYVASKLASDPVLAQIEALPGDFGRIVDVACGRGQLGIALLELGRASSVTGFDLDPRKIETARAAAGPDARFEVADAREAELPATDTVLVIDALHYLEPAAQARLLARAAARIEAGGRLLVRELDAGRGLRAWPAMLAERLARRLDVNRGRTLHFVAIEALVEQLEALDLRCTLDRSGSLSNVLIVAQREQLTASPA
jgi:SAM-dependent methyltransferase